jgi:hypothetical protein
MHGLWSGCGQVGILIDSFEGSATNPPRGGFRFHLSPRVTFDL